MEIQQKEILEKYCNNEMAKLKAMCNPMLNKIGGLYGMDIDDFYLVVVLQMFTQLRDIHIHRTGIEIVVIYPDGLQGEIALQDVVGMTAEKREKLVFLCCELCLLVSDGEKLLLCVEHEASESVD